MKTTKLYFVYILTNFKKTSLYVGCSSNLDSRVHQHKTGFYDGFTKKYNINILVYFETYQCPIEAVKRERQVKKYSRKKKIELIEKDNPQWIELKPPISVF